MQFNMKLTLAVLAFSLMALPAAAASFICPTPQLLPATLNLAPNAPASSRSVMQVQSYLSNLKYIRQGYTRFRKRNQQSIIAGCLVYHVATLTDTNALQAPKTRADGATWFMLRQEVAASLALVNPRFLRNNHYLPLAQYWLSLTPVYGVGSPYQLSTR